MGLSILDKIGVVVGVVVAAVSTKFVRLEPSELRSPDKLLSRLPYYEVVGVQHSPERICFARRIVYYANYIANKRKKDRLFSARGRHIIQREASRCNP